jgi:hypothetical protein
MGKMLELEILDSIVSIKQTNKNGSVYMELIIIVFSKPILEGPALSSLIIGVLSKKHDKLPI